MGASTSIIVFSCRNNFAPSSIILRATSSVTRPSAIKCALRISTRGFPRESNTSYALKRVFGGHGMSIIFQIKSFYSFSSKTFLLFITRSKFVGDIALFVVVIMDDVGGEDASDVLLDEEEFEILLDTVVLVAIMIMVYPSGRKKR